jgi:hypothetical protein
MSLPQFSRQTSLFSVNTILGNQFAADDRYRLFAERIHPLLVAARPQMEAAYCLGNGRPGIEPVLLLGVSILQFMERCPDRQALEHLKYHLGWKLALGRELLLEAFDPTSLVIFRQRLIGHEQAKLAFDAVLKGLCEAQLIPKGGKYMGSTHDLRQTSFNCYDTTEGDAALAFPPFSGRGGGRQPHALTFIASSRGAARSAKCA